MTSVEEKDRTIVGQRDEITTMKKIQNEQGKALNYMVNENDYPNKVKLLMDDQRYKREQILQLEQDLKYEKKTSQQFININRTQLQTIRNLKEQLRHMQGAMQQDGTKSFTNDDPSGYPQDSGLDTDLYDLNMPAYQSRSPTLIGTPKYTTPAQQRFLDQYSINESQSVTLDAGANDTKQLSKLERQNKILARAKESKYKKNVNTKVRFEKKMEKLLRENADQHAKLQDLEKDLKQTHIKMREFLQRNLKKLPHTAFDEIENIIVPGSRPTHFGPRSPHENRKMAETYKRVKEIQIKKSLEDKKILEDMSMDDIMNQYVGSKRVGFGQGPSANRLNKDPIKEQ